jgi:hypothetical protein
MVRVSETVYPRPKVAIGSRWRMGSFGAKYLITITEITEFSVRFQYDAPKPPWSRNSEGFDSYSYEGWHCASAKGLLERAENGIQRARRALCSK